MKKLKIYNTLINCDLSFEEIKQRAKQMYFENCLFDDLNRIDFDEYAEKIISDKQEIKQEKARNKEWEFFCQNIIKQDLSKKEIKQAILQFEPRVANSKSQIKRLINLLHQRAHQKR